jgi:transcription-repair coupling factor (superfamily II helicase)
VTLFDTLRIHKAAPLPQLVIRGATVGVKGYLVARLFAHFQASFLVVTPDARQRDLLYNDLGCLLADLPSPSSAPVYRYIYPTAEAPGAALYQQQRALTTFQPLWRLLIGDPVIVIAEAMSLSYGVLPPEQLKRRLLSLRVGDLHTIDRLGMELIRRGYRRVALVENVGEFSIRGGIVDLFSPGQAYPWRLEFFGDEIETIRAFETATQVSTQSRSAITIAPMHPLHWDCLQQRSSVKRLREHIQTHNEDATFAALCLERWQAQHPAAWPWGVDAFFYEGLHSLLDYLPASGFLCCVDTEDVFLTLQQTASTAALQLGEHIVAPLPAEHLIAPETVRQQLQQQMQVSFLQYDQPLAMSAAIVLRSRGVPQFFGAVERFVEQMQQWLAERFRVCILCRFALEAQRMQALLAEYELGSRLIDTMSEYLCDETRVAGATLIGIGEISQGFVVPEDRLVVIRAEDVLGVKKPQASSSRRAKAPIDFGALQPGDRVVHVDYGVGIYRRMTFLDVGREQGEFMLLEYADGARLYVPAYRLSVVQKYTGGNAEAGRIDRLGGSQWARAKERVKASLFAMAEELVRVHAARQTTAGYGFSPPTALHREFDNDFEYVETEDQLRAIQQVMEDMERPQTMERLVCGDVGYGKTEVAMRAAFKAAYDGKQVAVLVPTTVLTQQHLETFRRRFAPYPVEIAALSRMVTRKEQRRVLAGLRQGCIDIVIGTHRLLQKDIQFKDLGLLVVDEEHRFGVAHKERIKRLSEQVDVLMLTATPIPRSLHMALVGLRKFSVMETPPEGRSAIETVVTHFNDEIVQRAIRQELARGGQIFFVHNHIETLPAIQALLERLVPECRIGVVHGQMPERGLEKMMLQFLRREFDLMLCTTIIESGLDIPSVNTIMINRADRFGLAQLHQLRGRVGRGLRQAYAYLFIPSELVLSDVVRKRIAAIEEFNALGSSFQLAARDLEIRGAGNLLGPQQSGHIASVGFQLYCQMLEEAIRTTQGETVTVRVDPELRLDVQGHIPETYVASDAQRLEIYQRLATVADMAGLNMIAEELRDRFGAWPETVQQLLEVVELKILARQLALQRIEQCRDTVTLVFHAQTAVQPDMLLQWLQTNAVRFQFQSEHAVRFSLPASSPEARLAQLKKHLQQMLPDGSI